MPRFLRRHKKVIAVSTLLALIVVGWLLPVTITELWEWGARLSGHPLTMLGVVVLMATLMTFGLPGSLCFWMIAPFHAPWVSVAMLLAGSVAGAIGAYRVGRGLGGGWREGHFASRLLTLLTRRSDLLTQCALRIMPGVPHALINLAAGALQLGLTRFVSAALLGLGVKWAVYAHAVQGMVTATQAEEALTLNALAPLFAVAVLLIIGSAAQRYWFDRQETDEA